MAGHLLSNPAIQKRDSDSWEYKQAIECGPEAAQPQLEQGPLGTLDQNDFETFYDTVVEPSVVNIDVRAPDQIRGLDHNTIAVIVKSEGFRYVSTDDLFAAIYGHVAYRKVEINQAPARFTMLDGYSLHYRSIRRRAWLEMEKNSWGALVPRSISSSDCVDRKSRLTRRIHAVSEARIRLQKQIRVSNDRGHRFVNICIAEQLAELRVLKALYKSCLATLEVEEASRLMLLLGGLDVLDKQVAPLVGVETFSHICDYKGLDPKATPFDPIQMRVKAAILAKQRSAAAMSSDQLNGTSGEFTNSDDMAVSFSSRDVADVVVHTSKNKPSLQVVRGSQRTGLVRFVDTFRHEMECTLAVPFPLDSHAHIHLSGSKHFVSVIRKSDLLFRVEGGPPDACQSKLYVLLSQPTVANSIVANWWPRAMAYREVRKPGVIHSNRKNPRESFALLMRFAESLGGKMYLEGDELALEFPPPPAPSPARQQLKPRRKAYSAEGKMGGSDAGPKKVAKPVTKAEHKAINKAVRREAHKTNHKAPAKKGKTKAVKTPIGNRKPIVNGIVRGNAKDNQVEVLYSGVDETPKNFDNPWFVFNSQDYIKVMPVSLDGFASAFQVFPNPTGQPSQSVTAPPDLLSLLKEFTHYRVGKIKVTFESDVAELFGGSIAVMYIPSESPTYPATDNVNATYDFREMVKARDHMKIPAKLKTRYFTFPPIPGSRECVGEKSLLGYFVVWIREPYTTPNTSGPSSSNEAVVSSTPFSGKIGTFHVECEFLGQYRTYVSQSDRLFRAKTYELPFEPINPQTVTQLVSDDAMVAPFCVAVPPDLALAVADTAALRSGTASPARYRTISLYRGSETLTVRIPVILIPVAEAIAMGLGIPPGVATLAIEGVNAILTLGTYIMDAFEDKTFTVQQSNNQLTDGTCGTNIPAVTMSGIATSNMYQAGLDNRNAIVRTTAAYECDSNNSTSNNTTASGLWDTVNLLYSAGMRYLLYTWPEPLPSPVEIMRVTVYESTDSSVPVLKTVPAPVDVPQTSGMLGHTMETFGIPSDTFIERLHEDQVGTAFGSGDVFSYPTRRTAVFYQVYGGSAPRPLKRDMSRITRPKHDDPTHPFFMAAPVGTFVNRTGVTTFEAFPHMTIQQWQSYMGLKVLTPYGSTAFTTVRMSYMCLGAVTDVANVWNLDWTISTDYGTTYENPSPLGVAMCNVLLEDGSAGVNSILAELFLKDTLGRGVPFIDNPGDVDLLYRFVLDF